MRIISFTTKKILVDNHGTEQEHKEQGPRAGGGSNLYVRFPLRDKHLLQIIQDGILMHYEQRCLKSAEK